MTEPSNLEYLILPETDTALRYNTGKIPLSYTPLALMEGVSAVMEFGAKKYERDNWKKGFAYNSLIDCALRHIMAYAEGEDTDKESGRNHIEHAATNLAFLLHQIKHGIGTDDRTKGPKG